jgi:P-type E1-E2 ATPase
VLVAIDKQYVGRLHLRDTVRPNAASVISHLRDQFGLQIAMLTGDVESEARRVSKMLQIEVLSSHSLPREKQVFVQHIRERSSYNCVGMMGDGLNDAPALSTADVGITLSLGSKRPGAAISEATNSQVADVIFRSPDLSRLPELLEIARKTIRQSTWNLWWAIAYNVIAVSLAMGIAEPFGVAIDAARAGTMMALSSISVLAWSMWLRYGLSKIQFDPSNSK